jgi:small subunit ribosomal protein S1
VVANVAADSEQSPAEGKVDLKSLSSMLKARWKNGTPASTSKPEALQAGQIRSFRITRLDVAAKRIDLELI